MSRLDQDQWRPDPVAGYRPPQGVEPHGHKTSELAGSGMYVIATSTTRPVNPTVGMAVWETDSITFSIWDGTEWRRSASVPSAAYLSNLAVAVGNTVSTTYVDFPGPVDLAFTKRASASTLEVDLRVSTYMSVPGPEDVGVRINSVDYNVTHYFFNDANNHRHVTGIIQIAGLAAGAYTARVRWKTPSGNQLNTDGNDVAIMKIQEMK